jgi:dCMP deaminase
MSRPDWDTYFLQMAYLAASRATCDRKHVGAVIVVDRRVVSTGYNGSPKGAPSCDEVGHEIHQEHCVRTLHAESNAIDWAGRATHGASLYVTVIPCYDCAKRIVNAGITRVYYDEFYASRYGKSDQVTAYFTENKVIWVQVDTPGLHLFKELQKELDAKLAAALAVTLVKFTCGCEVPYSKAGKSCRVHDKPVAG